MLQWMEAGHARQGRHPFVPLGERDEMLVIAMPDPNNFSALDELEMLLKRPLQLAVSTRAAILAALSRSEGSSQTLKEIEAEYRPLLVREDDQGEEVLSVEKIAKDQSSVVRLVDTILLNALQKRVSDIHIEAADHAVHVKFRVDGILSPALDPLDLKLHAPLISRLKVMSELDISERRVPQDGRIRMSLEGRRLDIREIRQQFPVKAAPLIPHQQRARRAGVDEEHGRGDESVAESLIHCIP